MIIVILILMNKKVSYKGEIKMEKNLKNDRFIQ